MRLAGRWVGAWALLLTLALLIGAIVVWSSPRHRAFYFGGAFESRPGANPSRGSLGPTAATVAVAPPGAPGARPMVPDADGRIRLRVADSVPSRLPADGVPPGWATKEFVGRASIELVRDGTRLALRLRSEQTSFALYRDVVVNPNEFRFLAWSWKVVTMPDAGDVRERARDDQAAQLYLVFPHWPSPLTKSDVIGYVWDSRAPVGTRVTSSQAGNVKIIVVASGGAERGTWRLEQRDVSQDYVALFGRQAPRIGRVAIMIDTNDTGGTAEALVGDLVFARARVENMEMPTSMLR